MKIMKRMLLIHWHYFNHEMIEFDKINFLTGKNASGKSTIIDALQLVLLSDTSGAFFNKAASGRGNRTLTGYLRGELGDNETSGFHYLRNGRFTSYIALEFYDDVKKINFTSGCCFDTFGENDCQKLFFRFDDSFPENNFLKQNENGNLQPLSIEGLRVYIRSNYTSGHSYTTSVNRDFREDLCGKLGGLQPKRFSELLKKAVSFNPNVDIQQFITDFVCGEGQKVEVADMQENIRSYDILKKESLSLSERINLLSQIIDAHSEFTKHKESETLYAYLIDRSRLETKEHELKKNRENADKLLSDLNTTKEQLARAESEQRQLQDERDSLKLQLDSNENARRLDELQKQIDEKNYRYNGLKDNFDRFSALLHRTLSSWKSCVSLIKEKMMGIDLSIVDPMLRERIETLCSAGTELFEKAGTLCASNADDIVKNGVDKLSVLSSEADFYRDQCKSLFGRLSDAKNKTASDRLELKKEKESLEKGIYRFPHDAIDLKEAIENRLRFRFGPEAKAVIVAEDAEIQNDRWRNVIEGYLYTQRFYVIVAPEHFYTAFQLYDSIKRQKAVYTTGLVDTEKLQRLNPTGDGGSLAEEIDTTNPAVRLFIDFTLGRVQKCDSIREIRRYRTSITDDGVLYQNFVVRAMDPKRWKSPAIGQVGARLRLEAVNAELQMLSQEISLYAALTNAFQETDRILRLSDSDAEQIVGAANNYQELPVLEEVIKRLKADAETIDKSEIEALKSRFAERENDLVKISDHIRKWEKESGSAEEKLRVCQEETIPMLDSEVKLLQDNMEASYNENWVEQTGALRYERELSTRGSAEEIYRAFPREQSRSRNSKEAMWEQVRDFRRKYNDTYKMGYDINAPENEVYDQAYLDYSENKLPEYEAKIEDTRQKAFQQFQEDFLSRLQSNIRSAHRQIDELNASIRGASFGEDTYRFRIIAKPDYKRYHDMIVDEMLLAGGYNLLSDQYNAKYKDEIAELFAIITNDSGTHNALGYDDYEKRVQAFTDYKTYLDFDLEVIKPNCESERLSKTMGKKSGGETQTPFYIAVLASFVQLYRVGRDKVPNTARLILFDEAFSKMDGERIIQSIELLRRFNFQTILSAPPDKIADIATLVDRNLCVLREERKTCVRVFDPRQMEEFVDE